MTNARRLAYQVLLNYEKQASYPDRLIRAALHRSAELKGEDRALLTELVYGVLRWKGTLDWHLDLLCSVKPRKIVPEIRILLRLALYQILYLTRVPHYAAVNETVKIVKAAHPPHVAGFVNAVLREAVRRGEDWPWPSPDSDPDRYLAVTTSHPLWFVQRFRKELGFEATHAYCQANNMIAPLTLRHNPEKISPSALLAHLQDHALNAAPSSLGLDAIRVTGPRQDPACLPGYRQGWFQVQDEASQLVSLILDPHPGERILDLCAGFGGKSTHLGLLMDNAGEIIAVDQSSWKLQELQANARRQGIAMIKTVATDVRELLPAAMGDFDRVLLDAPCSGFGTLRRKPDIKWRRQAKDPYRFSQLQTELLQRASLFVKKGGILVYATCTPFSEEDEAVADAFSRGRPGWVQEPASVLLPEPCRDMVTGPFFKSWPHRHGVDGFFAARWRREE